MMTTFIKKHTHFCMAFIVMLLAYYPTLLWMWGRWFAADSYYSHGFLIPLVSGYLIWQDREALAKIPAGSSRVGLVVMILGMLFHFLCAQFRINFAGGFAMYVVFLGLLLHFFGWRVFNRILFPVLFLIFMLPLPSVVIVRLSFQLKMMAATLATEVLNHFRIPAVQEGSIIRMRHAQVVVDDVCSGLRSLISLTALGAMFAYWMKGAFWKKIVLFAMTIPIAIVTNMCRVVILAGVSEIWGAQYIEGFVHDATGYMIFLLAFIILFFTSKLLE